VAARRDSLAIGTRPGNVINGNADTEHTVVTGLAGADMPAVERDQAPDRLGHRGHEVPYVELHHLVAVSDAGTGDVDAHLHPLAVLQRRERKATNGQRRVRMTEGGVAAAVAEVELRAELQIKVLGRVLSR